MYKCRAVKLKINKRGLWSEQLSSHMNSKLLQSRHYANIIDRHQTAFLTSLGVELTLYKQYKIQIKRNLNTKNVFNLQDGEQQR